MIYDLLAPATASVKRLAALIGPKLPWPRFQSTISGLENVVKLNFQVCFSLIEDTKYHAMAPRVRAFLSFCSRLVKSRSISETHVVGAILPRSLERHGECQFCSLINLIRGCPEGNSVLFQQFRPSLVLIDSCEKRFGVVKWAWCCEISA